MSAEKRFNAKARKRQRRGVGVGFQTQPRCAILGGLQTGKKGYDENDPAKQTGFIIRELREGTMSESHSKKLEQPPLAGGGDAARR